MPIATNSLSDVNIPTVNGDADTWGQILIDYFTALDTKIHDLQTRITTAETQLGSTSTVGSVSYANDRVTNINTHAQNAGLVSADLLTGTNTTILPDPFSGNHTMTTSFPYFTGSGEILDGVTPPTTESEINAFGFQSFAQALLNYCTNTIQPKVSQAEADLLQARIDTCKAKKYIDARLAGGTVTRSFTGNSFGFTNYKKIHVSTTVRRYEALSTSATSHTGGSFTGTTVPSYHEQYMPMSAGNSLTLLLYSQHGSNIAATYPNLGDTWQSCEVEVDEQLMPASAGLLTATILRYSENPLTFQVTLNYTPSLASGTTAGFLSSTNNATNGFFTINNNQNILVYTTPDVSSCDTSPGGPYYATGTYT